MRVLRVFEHRLRSLLQRERVDSDLRREIELHIDQLAQELTADGLSESEARLAAQREFGPVTLMQEQCRDTRRIHFIEDLARDLAFAVRALARSPGFTLTALLSLALGIGANTAVYTFLDAVLLRALPVPDPQSLAILNWRAKGWPKVAHAQHGDGYNAPDGVSISGTFPYPFFESLGASNDVFSSVFAFATAGRFNVVVRNQASLADGEYISANFFSAIAAPPAAGRLIGNEDARPGAAPVVAISYQLAKEQFGNAQNAIGKSILLNRIPFTIAGVVAPEFHGISRGHSPAVYVPLPFLSSLDPRARNNDWFHEPNTYWIEMMGRLRPGVTLRQAESVMAARFHAFVAGTATTGKERSNLPELWLQEGRSGLDFLRRQYSKPLFVLLAMTATILAIACSNIANLLLSRATTRRREIAVRLSLGAARLRVIRQLLTESILIALVGGVMGLLVAAFGIRFLTWLLASGQGDFTLHVGIDVRILLFTFSISLATGILFGLVPAIQATKVDIAPALKESRTAAERMHRAGIPFGLSQVLVAGQIALSLLLVIAAGLFVRTLVNLHSVAVGFNTQKLLLFTLDAQQAGYDEERGATLYENLRERFAAIPGVRAATMTDMPLLSDGAGSNSILVPGMPASPDHPLSTNVLMIGPSFFHTMQIPILQGRAVAGQDTAKAPRVVVVNQVFADKFFHGRNVIGQHFAFEAGKPVDVQIVGVARNSLYSSLKSTVPPVAYVPWSQSPGWLIVGMYYELRTAGDPIALANTVRQIVHEANPALPVADVKTQARYIDATIAPERTFAHLCTWFGLLALSIACIGLYGTMAYAVARRTNEIGVRMALGAQRREVIWMVQREVLVLSLAGIAIGLLAAWQAAHWVSSFLFGIRPNDALVFGLSTVILIACALAAGYAPARHASRIDPMQALRNE